MKQETFNMICILVLGIIAGALIGVEIGIIQIQRDYEKVHAAELEKK